MIMSIGTMSAPINSFNSLTGSQATRKTAVPKLKQLSIKREVDRTRRSPGWDRWTTANAISLLDKLTARCGPDIFRDQYSNSASNGVEVSL